MVDFCLKFYKIRLFPSRIFQWVNRIDGCLLICSKKMPMENGIGDKKYYRA